MREDEMYVYVFNFQKFNRKTKQTKNKKSGKTTSVVVRPKHYIAYMYRIPKAWLKETKNEVQQGRNTFTIKKRR